jgi:hypothetical protein
MTEELEDWLLPETMEALAEERRKGLKRNGGTLREWFGTKAQD